MDIPMLVIQIPVVIRIRCRDGSGDGWQAGGGAILTFLVYPMWTLFGSCA